MAANWITRTFSALAREVRSSLENPQTPLSYPAEWLLDIFNGGRTDSGLRVSELTALQVGTILACVNLISDGISSQPLHVYEKVVTDKRAGKKVAHNHNLYDLLHNEPNPEMTSPTWIKTLLVHCLLWGNGYCELQRDQSAQIVAIWPRNPAKTRPIRLLKALQYEGDLLPPGTLLYETTEQIADSNGQITEDATPKVGTRRIILAEDMIHVPGLSLDGRLGQSTVWLARQIIGLALASEKYGAKFFGNGARPAGVLTVPGAMQPVARDNLKRSWAEAHGGENSWKTALLENGVTYAKIAATPNEGQLLETRTYQRSEICAVFGVPLHMVAASEKGGKSNVEQSSIEFVLYCLTPWLVRIEKEFSRKLFPKMGRSANRYFPKFDVRKLMYPDAAARATFYNGGKQWGYLCTDDIHELEDMNPVGGPVGESYWMPNNMVRAEDIPYQNLGASAQLAFDKKNPDHQLKQVSTPPDNSKNPADNKPGGPQTKKPKPTKKVKRAQGDPIYILRHGCTKANDENLYRGWGDFTLDKDGAADAEKAGQFLKGLGITRIATSTLTRHKQTAGIVSRALGDLPLAFDDGFKTLNVGVYTGKSRDEYGEEVQWYLDHPDEPIPGGESLNQFHERNIDAFDKVREENALIGGKTLIVTSRSNIASLKSGGVQGEESAVVEPGGIYRLDADNTLTPIYGQEFDDSLAGT